MNLLDPVFNDLSTKPLASNSEAARFRVSGLLEVLAMAPDRGLGSSLRASQDFYTLELAPEYAVHHWLNDLDSPREEIEFLLTLAAKIPFYIDASISLLDKLSLTEAQMHESQSECMRAAYVFEAPLVSFHHDIWANPTVTVQISTLRDDGDILETSINQINFSCLEHFEFHKQWLESLTLLKSVNQSELWKNREILFPHLDFCPSVESQITDIDSSYFQILMSRLADLETMAAKPKFEKDSFKSKCSPSSSTTLQDFSGDYLFKTAKKSNVTCGWHLYLPDGQRIYFAPNSGKYVIGHVGKHLPTKNFPK